MIDQKRRFFLRDIAAFVGGTTLAACGKGQESKILFSRLESKDSPNGAQYNLIARSSSGETNVTNTHFNENNAQISPDGKSVTYYGDRYGSILNPNSDFHIYKQDLQTNQVMQMTQPDGAHYYDSAWSRDGKLIAYKKDEGEKKIDTNERGRIWIMDASGNNKRELYIRTSEGPLRGEMWKPEFAADGETLFITVGKDNNSHIYRVVIDSGFATKITPDDNASHWFPSAHPTNENIVAFTSNKTGTDQLYIIDLSTGVIGQLTNHNGDVNDPSWNKDGTRITAVAAYLIDQNNPDSRQYDVVEIDPTTGVITRVTSTEEEELSPVYMP